MTEDEALRLSKAEVARYLPTPRDPYAWIDPFEGEAAACDYEAHYCHYPPHDWAAHEAAQRAASVEAIKRTVEFIVGHARALRQRRLML